ncbi:MAG: PQQ-like beta-propeller repeat protein [Lachnospiraceae bacterium]|nr:PQQ-like beta-propeller repeat protein [Lachnospiraceae bacterium]
MRENAGSYLLHDNRLLFSYAWDYLFCYDLDTLSLEWKVNISNHNYTPGEITLFENMVACYGDHELLSIEMENGRIADRIKIPRINKLFHPIRLDDEHILLGYTNWTSAGVLKYNQKSKQVIWRNKRKFQGPQLRCRIYRHEDRVFWVKNDTEY